MTNDSNHIDPEDTPDNIAAQKYASLRSRYKIYVSSQVLLGLEAAKRRAADEDAKKEMDIVVRLLARYFKSKHGKIDLEIDRAPGFGLVRMLGFFCHKKTYELVIEPMHAEYLHEYFEALHGGYFWKAKLLKCQMHFYLLYAVISKKVFGLIGDCFSAAFKAKSDD